MGAVGAHVVIVQEHLPEFRVPFYEELKRLLEAGGVSLEVVYSPSQRNTFVQGSMPWSTPRQVRWFGGLGWQPVLSICRGSDLVVVQQELKYVIAPILMAWSRMGGPRVAYWGHGRNFQSEAPGGMAERIKKWLAVRADWWFAYNELSARVVENAGFPRARITSVNNSIDTRRLRELKGAIGEEELECFRESVGLHSRNVGIFTGGMYPNKRIQFLLEACEKVRAVIDDFEMIFVGHGPDSRAVLEATRGRSWIRFPGVKTGREKVLFWAVSRVALMPGLVGLVVLDALALGVPLVTTAYPFHSPEIDYLRDGVNGVVVRDWEDSDAYAAEVVTLLRDEERRDRLARRALLDGGAYSIQDMASRFAEGIRRALDAPRGAGRA